MAGYTLEIAQAHLDAWLKAELELTTHQSYTIAGRSITRADLAEVRKEIQFWGAEVGKLQRAARGGGRNRVQRVIIRDL